MRKLSTSLLVLLLSCYSSFAKDVRVIDGDTIVLNDEKIRFSGIDAPELKQTCGGPNKKIFCGKLAKKHLIKKIGKKTPLCVNEGRDVYKRILAECFINGESLSSFMVRSGYAFAYRKYSKKFINDENFAKESNFGLWKMIFELPWDFRRK
jgi:endonuclease YncB( thermonuclease family)